MPAEFTSEYRCCKCGKECTGVPTVEVTFRGCVPGDPGARVPKPVETRTMVVCPACCFDWRAALATFRKMANTMLYVAQRAHTAWAGAGKAAARARRNG